MSITADEVYNGLDDIDSLYYCGSACFLSLAAKIHAVDKNNPIIQKILDLSYLDAFLFSYSRTPGEERSEEQKAEISKSLNYYKDVIDEIDKAVKKIEDQVIIHSIEAELMFLRGLQACNESIFDSKDLKHEFDCSPVVSTGDSFYSSKYLTGTMKEAHRLSLLASLKMAHKLICRKNMGKKPFTSFNSKHTLYLIESVTKHIELGYVHGISARVHTIASDLLDAEPEVKNYTLKQDFIYLASNVRYEYDALLNKIII